MTKYKRYAPIGGKKPIWIIVEDGNIINKNPTKKELKCIEVEPHKIKRMVNYKVGSICHRCIENNDVTEDSILRPGNACIEKDKDGNNTGEYICIKHWKRDYEKYDPNSYVNTIKSIANCRTGNIRSDSDQEKGNNCVDLVCELYNWENLNKTKDNHRSPIDCHDPKTGLYHQVQGRLYNPRHRWWPFTGFEDEWHKIYEDMICICKNKYGDVIERIYRFPSDAIKGVTTITIIETPSRGVQWYEKYRVKDLEELKKANDIWKKILEKRK
jgi:hypothetical protein